MTADLAEWLTQVWDEQEKEARFAHELAALIDYGIVEFQWIRFVRDAPGGMARSTSFDPGAPSPTEVLARIAADRQILAMHSGNHECPSVDDNCGWWTPGEAVFVGDADELTPGPCCPTVVLLAQPYADRPGFHEEWRV